MTVTGESGEKAVRLLEIVSNVTKELHPSRTDLRQVTLNSSFEKDLAIDSLARMELFMRIEKVFETNLPESLFSTAETPRDVLQHILKTAGDRKILRDYSSHTLSQGNIEASPNRAETLVEVLKWHVASHPDRLSIEFYSDKEERGEQLTYQELYSGARIVAASLQKRDVCHGESVAIMLATSKEYFFSFLGILMAGGIPVPIYPPARPSLLEEHLVKHAAILNNCQCGVLIAMEEAQQVAKLLTMQVSSMRHVVTPGELNDGPEEFPEPRLKGSDTALLQYTSGSTGMPKGVVLTHNNLLANLRSMGAAANVTSEDVIVSWLPLYHDMGLIGAWLGSLYFACPLIIMSPLSFLARPFRWLWAIHRYRATISAAPNFAYELALRSFDEKDLEGLNLSSWRFALNGAEAVSPKTTQRFCETFAPFGFKPEAMSPVYGLAENSVGVAFPPMDRKPLIDRIKRDVFLDRGHAVKADDDETAMEVVGCGFVIPWHEIRVVDANDRELPERQEGRLQFCGPSSTSGYLHNLRETERLFDGKWLDSEDLAYIADGELFVTGRSKDIIIKAGRNIYPVELEEAVGKVDGIRDGNVAVFGSIEQQQGTEQLVVMAETRVKDLHKRQMIEKQINQLALDVVGYPVDHIVLVLPGTVLKTSSGKIRRKSCRDLYERGEINQKVRSVKVQAIRYVLSSLQSQIRRRIQALRSTFFALYSGLLAFVFALILAGAALVLPKLSWRWGVVRGVSRLLAFLTRTPLLHHGVEKLPSSTEPCVYIANHCSYLDHFALITMLKHPVHFVAKAELKDNLFLHIPLKRLGVEFVERFDQEKSVADAGRLAELTRNGHSLFFYPEGTFHRMPGLLPFHLGAFLAAEKAGVPICPIGIRGTRSILREGTFFPRHGRIMIKVGQMVEPNNDAKDSSSQHWNNALSLRNKAREQLLDLCGEPDLRFEQVMPAAPEKIDENKASS